MESLQKVFAKNARSICEIRGLKEADLVILGVPAGSTHRGQVQQGQNMTIQVLEKWAKALKTPAWVLLHPGSKEGAPPVLKTEEEFEAEVERRARERVADLLREAMNLHVDPEEIRPDGRNVGKPFLASPLEKGGAPTTDPPRGAAREDRQTKAETRRK